jgi:hypothetical protein
LFATFVVMLVMLGLVRPASATPINYQESVSGDLPDSLPVPAAFLFPLDVGVNTVSGTASLDFSNANNAIHDIDSFAFTVPVGMVLTDISYAFVRSGNSTTGFYEYKLFKDNALVTALGVDTIDLFAPSPKSIFVAELPLSDGTYGFETNNLGVSNGGRWTDDYTWSLTVARTDAPVPEPASLALLGSGLIGAGVRRWRIRRTAA